MLFSDEDDELDFDARRKELHDAPIFKKGREIAEIVHALCNSVTDEHSKIFTDPLLESGYVIPAKIAGAFHSDSWLICMENASLVRHHAQYLLTATSSLSCVAKVNEDHARLLRTTLLQFRELFIEWCDKIHQIEKNEWDEDEWVLYRR